MRKETFSFFFHSYWESYTKCKIHNIYFFIKLWPLAISIFTKAVSVFSMQCFSTLITCKTSLTIDVRWSQMLTWLAKFTYNSFNKRNDIYWNTSLCIWPSPCYIDYAIYKCNWLHILLCNGFINNVIYRQFQYIYFTVLDSLLWYKPDIHLK